MCHLNDIIIAYLLDFLWFSFDHNLHCSMFSISFIYPLFLSLCFDFSKRHKRDNFLFFFFKNRFYIILSVEFLAFSVSCCTFIDGVGVTDANWNSWKNWKQRGNKTKIQWSNRNTVFVHYTMVILTWSSYRKINESHLGRSCKNCG